jgi:DNA invertase Pin-like site-specific DNA recombinase
MRRVNSTEGPARRAAIYCRLSKIPQAELEELAKANPGLSRRELLEVGSSLGVERQEKACREIAGKHHWEVVRVFKDDDRSAYRGKLRPDYLEMLDDIKAGNVNAVIAWSPKRLIRHPRELEDFIDLLDAQQVEVATHMAGDYDLSTAGGRLVARVVGAVARHESEERSERLVLKMAQKREAGEWLGGKRPYGYKADGVTPEPAEAAVVVQVVSRVAAGETVTALARDLNERGITTADGKAWRPANLRRMVLNPRYIGHATQAGEDVGEASWPALVDEATWRRAHHLLNAPDRPKHRWRNRFLLSGGLIRCGQCGATLISARHHNRPSYRCPITSQGGCGGVAIRAEPLEELISDQVIRRVESRSFAKALRGRDGADKSALSTIKAIEAERDQLARALGSGAITMREFSIARGLQDDRLAKAQAQTVTDRTSAAVARYAGRPGALSEEWAKPEFTLDRKRAVIKAVIDHVVIDVDPKRGSNTFQAQRVQTPVWRV